MIAVRAVAAIPSMPCEDFVVPARNQYTAVDGPASSPQVPSCAEDGHDGIVLHAGIVSMLKHVDADRNVLLAQLKVSYWLTEP